MSVTRLLLCLAACAVLGCGTAAAQAPPADTRQDPAAPQTPAGASDAEADERVWDIQVSGGYSSVDYQRGGTSILPPTGAVSGGLLGVSTFLLGEGARLFNQNQVSTFGSQAASITALDPVVQSSIVERQQALTVGLHVTRAIGRRFAVEIGADYSPGHLAFTPSALSVIDASRASFAPALLRALSISPVASSASAQTTVADRQTASQLFATGSLIVNLKTTGRMIPYLSGGGGVVFNNGNLPSATVTGVYQFGDSAQVFGTDTVTIAYSLKDRVYAWTGGAGLKYAVSPRWGLRFDARARVYANSSITAIDITPGRSLESTGAPFPVFKSGALQFGPAGPMTGSPVAGFTSFAGKGLQGQVALTAGLFLRF